MSGKVILITWEGYRSPHCSSLIVFMPGSLLLSPFLVFCISLLCLKELCSQPVPLNKSSVLSTGSTIEPERVSALHSYFSITIETQKARHSSHSFSSIKTLTAKTLNSVFHHILFASVKTLTAKLKSKTMAFLGDQGRIESLKTSRTKS